MAEIKAECTWGEGPDVLVCVKDHPVWLMADVVNKSADRFPTVKGCVTTTHGFCFDTQLDLTIHQALKLAKDLLDAAMRGIELNDGIKKYNDNKDLPIS